MSRIHSLTFQKCKPSFEHFSFQMLLWDRPRRRIPLLLSSFVLLLAALPAHPQQPPTTGTPPFGSFDGGPDVINLGNLNSHIAIPMLHKWGRGTEVAYDLSYDSSVWYKVTSGGTTTWQPVQNWGWRGVTEAATGYTSTTSTWTGTCNPSGHADIPGQITLSNWIYHDPFGISHTFSGSAIINTGNCPAYGGPNSTGFTSPATDGSGYTLVVTGSPTSTSIVQNVFAEDGTNESVQQNLPTGAASGTDSNGNQINVDSSNHFYDTLNGTTPAMTVSGSGTPTSPMNFTYTAASGSNASFVVNYTAKNIKTNFGCSGISEYTLTTVRTHSPTRPRPASRDMSQAGSPPLRCQQVAR